MYYYNVITEIKHLNVNKNFIYKSETNIPYGVRVLIPFGKQELVGFVINKTDEIKNIEIKEIIKVIDEVSLLNDELISLGHFMEQEYLCYLVSAYSAMLPNLVKISKKTKPSKLEEKYVKVIKFDEKLTLKQKEIIDFLKKSEIKKSEIPFSQSIINTLIKKGILEVSYKPFYKKVEKISKSFDNIILNEEQNSAINNIDLTQHHEYLIHGVTGSGKTEVYLKLMESIIKNKKKILFLVPEIALTKNIVERVSARFSNIATLHSGLTAKQKLDEYRRINDGLVDIVIGTRSSVFAPLENIGLIIIDESHDSSYMQENHPKYDALTIALKRGEYHNCPVVLGSATPSISQYVKTLVKRSTLLELKNRANKQSLPIIEIIDMTQEKYPISKKLINEIKIKLEKKEQIILYLNRKGHSNYMSCSDCGAVHKCQHCDVSLTYYYAKNQMRCHYCGVVENVLNKCPECSSNNYHPSGLGTEQLEIIVKKLFKDAKVLRLDLDAMQKRNDIFKYLEEFENQKYDILVGTQMITKGLDFPNVTLVGIVNIDNQINMPEYYANETVFQAISQVSGRSGRSLKKGKVILQTCNIENKIIQKALKYDYQGFVKEELEFRKLLDYPPYFHLSFINVKSLNSQEAYLKALNILEELQSLNISLSNVSERNIFKINKYYCYQIMLKYKDRGKVLLKLKEIMLMSNNKITIDIVTR